MVIFITWFNVNNNEMNTLIQIDEKERENRIKEFVVDASTKILLKIVNNPRGFDTDIIQSSFDELQRRGFRV